jgi:hypothetical protein
LTDGNPADGKLLRIGLHRSGASARPNGAARRAISGSLPAKVIA